MAALVGSHLLDCGGADGPPTPSCAASRPVGAAAAVVVAAGIAPPAAAPSPEPPSASEWGSCEAAASPSPSPCETASGRPCRVRAPRPLPEGFSPDGGEPDSGDEAAGDVGAQHAAPRKFRGVWLDRKRNKFKTRIWVQGRTLFLGSHTDEDEAARAYDQVAISRGGAGAFTNFPLSDYDVEALVATPLPTLVAELRGQAVRPRVEAQSSRHRGVCRHKQTGKWSARIQDRGAKFFLGLFDTEEQAAEAFDKEAAAIARGHSCSGSLEVEVPRTPRAPRKHYALPDDDLDYEPDPDEARAPPRPPKKRRTPSAGSPWARGDGCSAGAGGDMSAVHAALTLLRMAAAA